LIRPLDRAKIFARVSGGRFPYGCYGIATRRRGGLIGHTSRNGSKWPYNRSDQWIALKFLHEFLEAVSLRVVMESQLDDEEVSSARLE
jgi:hypothetical protein